MVPSSLLWEIVSSEAESTWTTSRRCSLTMVNESLDGCSYPMDFLERYLGEDTLKSYRVLEVGCGNGFSLCYMLNNGVDAFGIEPGSGVGFSGRPDRVLRLLEANGVTGAHERVRDASAEDIPFPDGCFDVIFSVAVLEHVKDLDKAMSESIRVLKKGGVLWANLPDYSSNYEAHYDMKWPPPKSKYGAKRFVESRDRNSSLIDELTFVTPKMFDKYLDSKTMHGVVYRYGRGWTNTIFTAYNGCCDLRLLPCNVSGVAGLATRLLRHSAARHVVRPPLSLCTKILQRKGYSSVFDLILYKDS